jgi:hypothetical protein
LIGGFRRIKYTKYAVEMMKKIWGKIFRVNIEVCFGKCVISMLIVFVFYF